MENRFIISGQGIFFFQEQGRPCCFSIYDKEAHSGLYIEIGSKGVIVNRLPEGEPLVDLKSTGLSDAPYYWVSLDYQNQFICLGAGEARIENAIYQYTMGEKAKRFLESLCMVNAHGVKPLRIMKDPILRSGVVPMLVKDMDSLTMDDIAAGTFLP